MTYKQLLIKKLLEIKKIDEWKNYQFCINVKNMSGTFVFDFFPDGKNLIKNRFFHPINTIKFLIKNIEAKNYFIRERKYNII